MNIESHAHVFVSILCSLLPLRCMCDDYWIIYLELRSSWMRRSIYLRSWIRIDLACIYHICCIYYLQLLHHHPGTSLSIDLRFAFSRCHCSTRHPPIERCDHQASFGPRSQGSPRAQGSQQVGREEQGQDR
jgi:hypothetical protein